MASSGNLIDPPLKISNTLAVPEKPRATTRREIPKSRAIAALLAVPVASAVALAVHLSLARREPSVDPRDFTIFLGLILGSSIICLGASRLWPALRAWMTHISPILAAAIGALCLWEVITSGLRLLPLPYFPSPAGVLQ